MERVPYGRDMRGRGGGMEPRYDRSQPRDVRVARGRPAFNMPVESYPGPYMQAPPAPAPHPGYGTSVPPLGMGESRGGYRPRPAVVDATGASVDTARHAKRLYVGNIPNDTVSTHLESCGFLNVALRQVGGCFGPGNAVLNSSFLNLEKRFMFVEMRSVEETYTLLQLDGLSYRDHYLKIRRPVDYEKFPVVNPTKQIPKLNVSAVGIISTQVEDSPYKLFIGGLPHEMQEDQVKNMLLRFGQLKSFYLVKERNDKNSKGYAFCEYMNEESTQGCVAGLNNVTMGHRTLTVKRTGNSQMSIPDSSGGQGYPSGDLEESKGGSSGASNTYTDQYSIEYFKSMSPVVCLKNILTEDDLKDQSLYDELYEDIKFELEKFGPIKSMIMPRHQDVNSAGSILSAKNYSPNSLCKVYIEYNDISAAFGAYNLMNGKIFNSKPLEIIFYDRDAFKNDILD